MTFQNLQIAIVLDKSFATKMVLSIHYCSGLEYLDHIVKSLQDNLLNFPDSIDPSKNTPENLQDMIFPYLKARNGKKCVGILHDNRLAGIILYEKLPYPRENWVFIQFVGTFLPFRRKGLMTRLLNWLCINEKPKGLFSIVNCKNTSSRRLFEKNGFEVMANHYSKHLHKYNIEEEIIRLSKLEYEYIKDIKTIVNNARIKDSLLGGFILNLDNLNHIIKSYLCADNDLFHYALTENGKLTVSIFAHISKHTYGECVRCKYCIYHNDLKMIRAIKFMENKTLELGYNHLDINVSIKQKELGTMLDQMKYGHIHDIYVKIL